MFNSVVLYQLSLTKEILNAARFAANMKATEINDRFNEGDLRPCDEHELDTQIQKYEDLYNDITEINVELIELIHKYFDE